MYEKGLGTEKNEVASFHWYTKAAEQGHPDAQNEMGALYQEGKGVKQSNLYAYMWYEMAARQKLLIAEDNRNTLARTMRPPQVKQAKALAETCFRQSFKNCRP
jgi:TPR repeat protein